MADELQSQTGQLANCVRRFRTPIFIRLIYFANNAGPSPLRLDWKAFQYISRPCGSGIGVPVWDQPAAVGRPDAADERTTPFLCLRRASNHYFLFCIDVDFLSSGHHATSCRRDCTRDAKDIRHVGCRKSLGRLQHLCRANGSPVGH